MDNVEKYNEIGEMCADDWTGMENEFVERALHILRTHNSSKEKSKC